MRTGNEFGGGPRAAAAQLARAAEIATILSASGFDWLVQALGLSGWVSPRHLVCAFRRDAKCLHDVAADVPLPERLRLTLERLGPTFVKAGQMLALRPDYVPLEYAEALRGLHTHAAPFPAAEAVAIIEAELGAPLGALYAEFNREPFAAASLAQVHRARLFDGREVAVKVQRPGVRVQVDRDLALLATLAATRSDGGLKARKASSRSDRRPCHRRPLPMLKVTRPASALLSSLAHRAMLAVCRAPAAVIGIRRRHRRRAEPDNLSAYALLQPFPLDKKYSACAESSHSATGCP